MNKTALNWLRQELEYLREFEEFYTKRYQKFDELFNKAKAIEKKQIKDAFIECWMSNVPYGAECKLDAEQYYNETFKSE